MHSYTHKIAFAVLAGFIFTVPWQTVIVLPGIGPLAKFAGLLLVVAGVLSVIRGNGVKLRAPSLMLFIMALFVLWVVFSTLWSVYDPNASLGASSTFIQLTIMVWIIWDLCRSQREHLALLQAFVLGAYVVTGSIILDFIANPFVPNSEASLMRYTGFGGDPNNIAAMMALGLPIAWYLTLVRSKGLFYWLNLAYLPLSIFAIVLTASRGGFLIAVVGLGVIPFTYTHLNRWRKLAVVVLLGVMFAGVVITIPKENFRRISETSTEVTEGNVSNRSGIWLAGLKVFGQYPLLGVGAANFSAAVEPILGHRIGAHNAFLLVLAELGVVGLLLFTLAFVVTLLPLLHLRSPHRAFYVFLWLALIVSILPSNANNDKYVWVLLALFTTRRAYVLTLPNFVRAKPMSARVEA